MKQSKNIKLSETELKALKELGEMKKQKTKNQTTGLKSFINRLSPQTR